MQCTKIGLLNLHTKRYLVGSLEVVSLCLYFYIFTSMISFFKLLLFKLLYLLMLLTFVICTTPILIFLRQLSTLNNVKLTTGLGPTNFLPLWRPVAFGDFRKKTRLNALAFVWEYLHSCSGYGPGWRGKSSSQHSKKILVLLYTNYHCKFKHTPCTYSLNCDVINNTPDMKPLEMWLI